MNQYRPTIPDFLGYLFTGVVLSLIATGIASLGGHIPSYWVGFVGGSAGAATTCYLVAEHMVIPLYYENYRLRREARGVASHAASPEGPTCNIAGADIIRAPLISWSDREYRCHYDTPDSCS